MDSFMLHYHEFLFSQRKLCFDEWSQPRRPWTHWVLSRCLLYAFVPISYLDGKQLYAMILECLYGLIEYRWVPMSKQFSWSVLIRLTGLSPSTIRIAGSRSNTFDTSLFQDWENDSTPLKSIGKKVKFIKPCDKHSCNEGTFNFEVIEGSCYSYFTIQILFRWQLLHCLPSGRRSATKSSVLQGTYWRRYEKKVMNFV